MSAQVFAAISLLLSWSTPKIVPIGSYLSKTSQEIYLIDSAGLKKKPLYLFLIQLTWVKATYSFKC